MVNPGRGFKPPPHEPPGSSAGSAADDDEFDWETQSPFDRPTLIPATPPTEDALMGAVPPAPPLPNVPQSPRAVASDEWDQPSAVIKRSPSRPSMPELELDLDDLGPGSSSFGAVPRASSPGRGRADPISLRPAPPPPPAAKPPPAPAARPSPPPPPAAKPAPAAPPRPSPPRPAPPPPAASQAQARSSSSAPTTRPPPPNTPSPARLTASATSVPRHAPLPRPPTGAQPAAPADEVNRWGAGSRVPVDPVRHTMPTLMEEDPLAFDLHEELGSPERVSFPDDLGIDLDALRDPKMRQPSQPTEPPISPHPEPHTAPYPIEEHRLSAPAAVGQFRQPPSVSPPLNTVEGLSDLLDEDTLLGPPPVMTRAPLMGDRPAANPQERALREMRDKFALGDFSGALRAAETILDADASHAEAARYGENCRARLRGMYEAKLGSLNKVPRVILPPDQVRWLSLDHRAGFVLSCVDGYSTIEEILDVSGMSTLDALRILHDLLLQKVIAVP